MKSTLVMRDNIGKSIYIILYYKNSMKLPMERIVNSALFLT